MYKALANGKGIVAAMWVFFKCRGNGMHPLKYMTVKQHIIIINY